MKKLLFCVALTAMLVGCSKTADNSSGNENAVSNDTSATELSEPTAATAETETAISNDADKSASIDLSGTVITLKGEAASKPVVIDFSATWCPPCQKLAPLFHQWEQEYGQQVTFITIDVDQYPELASSYGASAIPYIVAYSAQEGEVAERRLLPEKKDAEFTGYQPDAIKQKIAELSRQE